MAFSKLLQRDTDEVTPAQAGAAFAEEAKRIAREQNIDLAPAWQLAKKLHPECHARLCEGAQPTVTLANDTADIAPAPLGKALYLPMLKLPPDTTDDEFKAAWAANGGRVQPLKAENVLISLMAFTKKNQNVSMATARDIVLEKFTALAVAAGEKKSTS